MKMKRKSFPWLKLVFFVILAGSFCNVSVSAELDSTLIGYWSFDEGKGEEVYWSLLNPSQEFSSPSSILKEGENLIAVYLYNSPGSSDAYFNLEMEVRR